MQDNIKSRLSASFELTSDMSNEDFGYLRKVCKAVMTRAAAFLSVAVHSMQMLHDSTHNDQCRRNIEIPHDETPSPYITVSCLGSVIEKYPGFQQQCQTYLDNLQLKASVSTGLAIPNLKLAVAQESSLTGVAVAALMARSSHDISIPTMTTATTPRTTSDELSKDMRHRPQESEAIPVQFTTSNSDKSNKVVFEVHNRSSEGLNLCASRSKNLYWTYLKPRRFKHPNHMRQAVGRWSWRTSIGDWFGLGVSKKLNTQHDDAISGD